METTNSSRELPKEEVKPVVLPEEYHDTQRPYIQLKCLNQFRLAEIFTDFTVVIGERRFPTHRVVLAAISDYFQAYLLRCEVQSPKELILDNRNIDPEVFLAILDYAYTGQLNLSKDNVQSLLVAANYFNIPYLERECQSFMIFHFDIENICQVLRFSYHYILPTLRQEAEIYFTRHLRDAINLNDYLDIDPRILVQTFSNDNIVLNKVGNFNCPAIEAIKFRAVLQYQSQKLLDQDVFEMLLRSIRLLCIEKEHIQQIKEEFAAVISSNAVLKKNLALHSAKKKKRTNEKPASHEFIHNGKRYGLPAFCRRIYPAGFDMCDPELEIASIAICVRPGIHFSPSFIGGITVVYRKRKTDTPDFNYCKGSVLPEWKHHEVNLLPGERITFVFIWTSCVASCVLCVSFITSSKREIGPFGSPIGTKHVEKGPYKEPYCLYSISCDNKIIEGGSAITNMALKWIRFQVDNQHQTSSGN